MNKTVLNVLTPVQRALVAALAQAGVHAVRVTYEVRGDAADIAAVGVTPGAIDLHGRSVRLGGDAQPLSLWQAVIAVARDAIEARVGANACGELCLEVKALAARPRPSALPTQVA